VGDPDKAEAVFFLTRRTFCSTTPEAMMDKI